LFALSYTRIDPEWIDAKKRIEKLIDARKKNEDLAKDPCNA
jgi:hypothetical protein